MKFQPSIHSLYPIRERSDKGIIIYLFNYFSECLCVEWTELLPHRPQNIQSQQSYIGKIGTTCFLYRKTRSVKNGLKCKHLSSLQQNRILPEFQWSQ